MKKRSDTIAAISTAIGKGGIGIIRISGDDALPIVSQLVQSKIDIKSLTQLKSRKLIHAHLLDLDKQPIDEILIAFMPPDRSFTGEFTIEINCHGGIALMTMTLENLIKLGARLADPGEFTKRAWENGKFDLIKAEAINQIITAESVGALKIAWKQYNGGLTDRCLKLRTQLIEILSYLQYSIDIENSDFIFDSSRIRNDLDYIKRDIALMISSSERNRSMAEGVWISIYGPPNVGKSSLFNSLLKLQRSIVCDIPGTTRDHVSERININGINIRLTDTAGIRETDDIIEKESIRRSYEQINTADILIYVLDGSKDISDDKIVEIEAVLDNNGLVVINKSDLEFTKSMQMIAEKTDVNGNLIKVSASTGYNIDALESVIEKKIAERYSNIDEIMLTMRQRQAMSSCFELLNKVDLSDSKGLDLMSYDISNAIQKIDEITGSISSEDVLDSVFKNFCVGK